jgi:mannosyltransferase OCH1-like enzyme
MEKIVWTYWENKPGCTKPPHVSLCQETLYSNLGDAELRQVTPDNLRSYLPEIHPNIDYIERDIRPGEVSLAIKAGIIRVLLIEKYGGLWIDSDAIILKNLGNSLEKLKKYEFIGMRVTTSERQQVVNNFFGSIPNGKIIKDYAAKIREMLSSKTVFKWNEVGSLALTPIVNANSETAYLYPQEMIHPLVAGKQHFYMDKSIKVADVINDDTITFMLFHRIFDGENPRVGKGLLEYNIKDLYKGKMLISKLFRYSLPEKQYIDLLKKTGEYRLNLKDHLMNLYKNMRA